MTTVDNSTAVSSALSQTQGSSTSNRFANLGEDVFMQLMITQMQNQNPLEPMSNSDFLAQLAQFSTTSGVQQLNNSFSGLQTSLQSYQALQASGLIGRQILVNTDSGVLGTDTPLEGKVALPSSTSHLEVDILDSSGQVVRHMNMGSQDSGPINFSWDGMSDDGEQMPPGVYKVSATASIDDQQTALATATYLPVDSVNLAAGVGQEVQLNVAGLGSVGMSQAIEVR